MQTCWLLSAFWLVFCAIACWRADERAMMCYNVLACSRAVACFRIVSDVAGVLACKL